MLTSKWLTLNLTLACQITLAFNVSSNLYEVSRASHDCQLFMMFVFPVCISGTPLAAKCITASQERPTCDIN